MNIEEFMHELDMLYKNQQFEKIEPYLLGGLEEAGDSEEAIVMLNDLMGYYRATSRHEDMVKGAKRVMHLIEKMKLEDTISHGTSLLNIATGYRAAGKYDEAEELYFKAAKIFESCIKGPDYRVATLYNNLGLLYIQTGRYEEAKLSTMKALKITRSLPDTKIEQASTYVNLGNICFMSGQNEEAGQWMEQAVVIYESMPGHLDTHYPAALAGLGQYRFTEGRLEESAAYYKRALNLIEKMYGRNDDWMTTYQNYEIVKDLIIRREAVKNKKMTGLEMSKAYYDETAKKLFEIKYADFMDQIAVGLVGEGSECLGFDDEYSTDHDFGPGFGIWLTDRAYKILGQELEKDYEKLPSTFRGMPARNTTKEGSGRVGVINLDEFFVKYTGYKEAPEVKKMEDIALWDCIPQENLRTVVNGEVFFDGCGELSKRRKGFEKYPVPVKLYKLANSLHKMAQAGQYNFTRGRKRKDTGMMYLSLSEFINAATETAYLLNDRYMPFYKWRMRGMDEFVCLKNIKDLLENLMEISIHDDKIEEKIENICNEVVKELNRQHITNTGEVFLDVQKDEVLIRMKECFETKSDKDALIEKIVEHEWEQFQHVENEGGRASCQDNKETFYIMRKSQFMAWDEPVLESYLSDLKEGEDIVWNLITEKYARMMESTDPVRYAELRKHMPVLNEQRKMLQEALVSIFVQWTKEVHEKYPGLAGNARSRQTFNDTKFNTSSETYIRGEISTYSDATLKLFTKMVQNALASGRNIVEDTLGNTVHMYGYKTMEEADLSCRNE